MRRARLFSLVASGSLILVQACTTWKATMAPLPEVVAAHPDRIRVTRRDSGQIEVKRPVVAADTLRGTHRDRPVAIPVDEILRVEARGASGARYGILAGVLIVVASAALILVLVNAMTSW
jgi:hypothetical protein